MILETSEFTYYVSKISKRLTELHSGHAIPSDKHFVPFEKWDREEVGSRGSELFRKDQ